MARGKSRTTNLEGDGRSKTGLVVAVLIGLASAGLASVFTYGAIASRFNTVEGRPLLEALRFPAASGLNHTMPPGGELVLAEVEIERPVEFLRQEIRLDQAEAWVFVGMKPAQVRTQLLACGVSTNEIERALSPALATETGGSTVIKPDAPLVCSLSPEARARLYNELGQNGANHYMQYPFCFEAESLDAWFENSGVEPGVIDEVKRLLYRRGTADCFSDLGIVLKRLSDEAGRLQLLRTLSRQTGVLPRLRVRSDTDLDRVLAYWEHGLEPNNVRPLLESLKRRPGGGTLSMIYLLPHFARDRLYTYPDADPRANAPVHDCHWTSMNFFNDVPDDRFGDPAFTTRYLLANFQRVPAVGRYGDIVLLLDEKGNAIHSAVYLAADLVFTKNGNNNMQSWMVMRLEDLLATYASDVSHRLAVYRDKRW
jgi:hypothetical protein